MVKPLKAITTLPLGTIRPFAREINNELLTKIVEDISKAVIGTDINEINRLVLQGEEQFPKHSYFVNNAIKAYMRCSRVDLAKDFFFLIMRKGFIPQISTIEELIDGFLKHSDVNKAKDVMKCLPSYSLKPSERVMTSWIDYYLREHQLEKAKVLFATIQQEGMGTTCYPYLLFVRYFVRTSDFQSATIMKQQMIQKGIKPNVKFYAGYLQELLRKQALDQVDKIVLEMESQGISPDEFTFNALIDGFARAHKLENVEELLKKMVELDYRPTVETYNRLLVAQASSLSIQHTHNILQDMNKQGIKFNAYTYVALIKGLIAKGQHNEAVNMILKMEKERINMPTAALTTLMQSCCENDLKGAVVVLQDIARVQKVAYTNQTFTVLMKFYLKHRKYDMVDGLLLVMQRRNDMEIGAFTYTTLLNHYVEHLELDRIKATLAEIENQKIEITDAMYNVLMKAFYVTCKLTEGGFLYRNDRVPKDPIYLADRDFLTQPVSVDRIHKMFEKTFNIPFRPSIHIFNDIICHFFFTGRYTESLECMAEILRCKLKPNLFTMTMMIKSRLYLEQHDQALKILRSMPQYGLKPTLIHCALIHHGLCRGLRAAEAREFMKEISTKFNIKANFVFYASMIYSYTKTGDYFKALEVYHKLLHKGMVPDTETCNYILKCLFELGRSEDALRLFEQMKQNGILRNYHSYSIIVSYLSTSLPFSRLREILLDSKLPGNRINPLPFSILLQKCYDECQMNLLQSFVELMVECCVQFSDETFPFIRYLYYRKIDSGDIKDALELLKKALTDLTPGHELDMMVESFKQACQIDDAQERLKELEIFLENIDEIREKILQVSPDLRIQVYRFESRQHLSRLGRLAFENGTTPEEVVSKNATLYEEIKRLSEHLTSVNPANRFNEEDLFKKKESMKLQ